MKGLSLRARLTLRTTVTFAALLALANVAIYLGARLYAYRELEAEARTVAGTEAASVVDDERGAHIHEFSPETVGLAETEKFVQVLDDTGRVLLRSRALEGRPSLLGPKELEEALAGRAPVVNVLVSDRRGRGVAVRKDEQGVCYVVLAGLFSDSLDRTLARLASLLAFVWVTGVVLTGALGHALATRALRPVEAITNRAAAIAAGDLQGRLAPPGADDEIGRMTERLNAMLERLQGALEGNRRFAAAASHELRSPLTAIRGEVEVALRRDREAFDYRETLASVQARVVEMGDTIGQLATLVRAREGRSEVELREVELTELVGELLAKSRASLLQRGVRAACEDLPPLVAYADRGLLTRLFQNVLANAIMYTRQGGRVVISGELVPSAGGRPSTATVRIRDEGPGIAPADWERIFEPFERLDPSRSRATGGQGLGLAIAREVARVFGGEVRVLESSERGSTFEILLPGSRAEPAGARPAEARA
jgi:two-component system OmpR family sensor kinase